MFGYNTSQNFTVRSNFYLQTFQSPIIKKYQLFLLTLLLRSLQSDL
jgi:hypothetical protein